MIDIQLPDGRVIEIDTDDPAAAVAAGRKVWERQQAEKGLNAWEMRVPIQQPGGEEIPWYEQPATPTGPAPNPELEIGGDAGRGFQIGAQGAGRGLAELAGAPVDIATMVLNAAPWAAESVATECDTPLSPPRFPPFARYVVGCWLPSSDDGLQMRSLTDASATPDNLGHTPRAHLT